jgi:hypothetical protein
MFPPVLSPILLVFQTIVLHGKTIRPIDTSNRLMDGIVLKLEKTQVINETSFNHWTQ